MRTELVDIERTIVRVIVIHNIICTNNTVVITIEVWKSKTEHTHTRWNEIESMLKNDIYEMCCVYVCVH